MDKKLWKRVCINLTEKDASNLRRITAYNGEHISYRAQKLVEAYIIENNSLLEALEKIRESNKAT